jgi:hypothetical protein
MCFAGGRQLGHEGRKDVQTDYLLASDTSVVHILPAFDNTLITHLPVM